MCSDGINALYTPNTEDDLEMVVKCVFQRMCVATFANIASSVDPKELLDFWNHHLSGLIWKNALSAAQKGDYDFIKKMIQDLLPSTVIVSMAEQEKFNNQIALETSFERIDLNPEEEILDC
jgi:hypothetical protein